MRVSAIIPTIGRPEVVRAVRSVVAQSVKVDPVVVLDRPELEDEVRARLSELPHLLVVTSGAVGGGAARNLGVQRALADVVAFLDDDDEWLPDKIEKQLQLVQGHLSGVIASRALLVGGSERVVPEVPYNESEPIVDYLLERSTIKLRRNFIQSSTLVMSKQTAEAVPWQEGLSRHQDWTLLIELRRRGVEILTHADPLVRVYQGSSSSISRSRNWSASEEWLNIYASDAKQRAQADFLCSVVLRSSIASREYHESLRILGRALSMRPHFAALIAGLSEFVRRP